MGLLSSFINEMVFLQPHKFEGKYHKFQMNEKLRKKEAVCSEIDVD